MPHSRPTKEPDRGAANRLQVGSLESAGSTSALRLPSRADRSGKPVSVPHPSGTIAAADGVDGDHEILVGIEGLARSYSGFQ
jgi:hypothetical protein